MRGMTHLAVAVAVAGLFSGNVQADPLDSHPAVMRAKSAVKTLATQAKATADDDFQVRDVIVDNDGREHVRMDRFYKGLRVIGGDMVVHNEKSGMTRAMSHTMAAPLALETAATLDADDAHAYAESLFGRQMSGRTKSSLVIYARGTRPTLAYEVYVEGVAPDKTPMEMHYIIDAHSLQLLDKWDDVHTAATQGTGKALTEGTVTLTTDSQSTGGYAMRDPSRGSHYVTNMKNRTSGNGTLFTDTDNVWGNFSTTDVATVAVDAQYGQNKTWDYFKNVHGRNGIANDGRGAFSRVHYSRNYVNAFWSDSCFCMTYGDGDGTTYLPLVALDVAGHEMSHGVTSRSANLTYSGESGGLNEATSDIFGTMVEYYANNSASSPNYLIGERIFKASYQQANPTKALRYMFKPSLDGRSPDCYSSTLGSLDVHYSSGVANHFFYLLAEGAVVPTGFSLTKNDLVCNGNTAITGIGRDAAARIWYRALTVYMTSNTNYAGARTATLKAATDLYGSGSANYNAVNAAWAAVSVQ